MNLPSLPKICTFSITVIAAGLVQSAHSQLYWTGPAPTGSTSPTGAWDALNTNWNPLADGTGAPQLWVAGSAAIFSAGAAATGAYTVTVDGSQSASGITVKDGNALTLAGSNTPVLTIGAGGITVNSPARLVTIAPLTSLQLSASQTWANQADSVVSFDTNAATAIQGVEGTGAITLTLNGASIFNDSFRLRGVISDGTGNVLSVVKTGSGRVRLDGSSTYTGGFILSAGRVDPGNNNSFGVGGILSINGGEIVPRNANRTFANPVVIGGDFSVGESIGGAAPQGSVTFTGTVNLGGAVRTIAVLAGSQAIDVSLNGVISNGGLIKTGSDVLQLLGANTYSGGTSVNAGTLAVGSTGSLGSGNVTLANSAGVILTLQNPSSIDDLATLTFGSSSMINMNFTGTETLWDISNGTLFASSIGGDGTYTASELNSFFGGTSFADPSGNALFAVIPEPSTYALVGGGLVILGFLFVRRSSRTMD